MFVRRLLAIALVALAWAAPARADLGPLEPIAELHRAVRDTLGLPEPLIPRLLERGLPDLELPAVGAIAQHARVPIESVVDLRLGGMSYADLTLHFGLTPEIYYVELERDPGPPYGNAWGHYRKRPRSEWREIRLPDADIVRWANLRLCVDRYRVAPTEVVALRAKSSGFAAVHVELGKRGAGGSKAKDKPAKAAKPAKPGKAKEKQKGPKGGKPGKPDSDPPR